MVGAEFTAAVKPDDHQDFILDHFYNILSSQRNKVSPMANGCRDGNARALGLIENSFRPLI